MGWRIPAWGELTTRNWVLRGVIPTGGKLAEYQVAIIEEYSDGCDAAIRHNAFEDNSLMRMEWA